MANNILKQLAEYFQENPDDIACVYLFGSQARQQSKPVSDVDVAVLYKNQVPGGFDRLGIPLAGELEKIIKKRAFLQKQWKNAGLCVIIFPFFSTF